MYATMPFPENIYKSIYFHTYLLSIINIKLYPDYYITNSLVLVVIL